MTAVLRQAVANLRSRKLQAMVIGLTVVAASMLLSIALAATRVTARSHERLIERSEGADLWVFVDPRRTDANTAAAAMRSVAGVRAVTRPRHTVVGNLRFGDEQVTGMALREWPAGDDFGRPLLLRGRLPRPVEGSLVLDRNVASVHGVDLGDRVDVLIPDGWHAMTVVGISVTSEMGCPYQFCRPQFNYVGSGVLERFELLPARDPEQETLTFGVRVADASRREESGAAISRALPVGAVSDWMTLDDQRQYSQFSFVFQRLLITAFSVVATVAAGVLVANAVGAAVRAQRRQVGLLKSVGFTPRQLGLVYLLEFLGLAAVASVVGVIVGAVAAGGLLGSVARQFGENRYAVPFWVLPTTVACVVVVTTLFALLPVRRVARFDVMTAIRDTGAEAGRGRLRRTLGLPLTMAKGISDNLTRPGRTALTVAGLALATATIAFAFILSTGIDGLARDPDAGILPDGDITLYRSPYLPHPQLASLFEESGDVTAWVGTKFSDIKFRGDPETFSGRFLAGDIDRFSFAVVEGRMFRGDDEVLVGYGLAEEKDISVGDRLRLDVERKDVRLRVSGIYRSPDNLGRTLAVPMDLLEGTDVEPVPGFYLAKLRPGADAQQVANEFIAAGRGHLDAQSIQDDAQYERIVGGIRQIMAALSLVLGFITAVGIFNSVWIGVQERRREFGLLKAVGMTKAQLAASVVTGALLLALVAAAVGLPLGALGTQALISRLGRTLGFGEIRFPIDVARYLLLVPGLALVAALGGLIPALRAGGTSVVQALHYE
jgi:putative ABC transport system permease protein